MSKVIKFESSYEEPYPVQVQGESYYRKNLEHISGYAGEDESVSADDFIARLILDDGNVHDENAVRVEIGGKIVGHLARPAAKLYRKRLAELGLTDTVGECYASIKGGGIKRSTGEQMEFGVRLDIDLETFKENINTPRVDPAPTPEQPVAQPRQAAAAAASAKPVKKTEPTKLKFIPMKGSGALYFLFVFPFIAVINLYILFFGGLWIGIQWLINFIQERTAPK